MSQMHRAKLINKTEIMLKILRPDITQQIKTDMDILLSLAELIKAHFSSTNYSPTKIMQTFTHKLKREVDFTIEGRSTERLTTLFQDNPNVIFPNVYWDTTTSHVLAIDKIKGTPLANATPAQLTPEVHRKLVENGARAIFRQCLKYGFFHTNPHPNNLTGRSRSSTTA